MPSKNDFPYPLADVSVVVIRDAEGRVLLDYNDNWGAFTLPMSKRHVLPPATEHGQPLTETPEVAASRAAAEMVGRPLDPATLTRVDAAIDPYNQSGRDGQWKRYTYTVFVLTLTDEPKPLPGHVAVWVTKSELKVLQPLSPTVARVLSALPN